MKSYMLMCIGVAIQSVICLIVIHTIGVLPSIALLAESCLVAVIMVCSLTMHRDNVSYILLGMLFSSLTFFIIADTGLIIWTASDLAWCTVCSVGFFLAFYLVERRIRILSNTNIPINDDKGFAGIINRSRMVCPACGSLTPTGQKIQFCIECGRNIIQSGPYTRETGKLADPNP